MPKPDGTFQTFVPDATPQHFQNKFLKAQALGIFSVKLSKLQIHNNLHLTGTVI